MESTHGKGGRPSCCAPTMEGFGGQGLGVKGLKSLVVGGLRGLGFRGWGLGVCGLGFT